MRLAVIAGLVLAAAWTPAAMAGRVFYVDIAAADGGTGDQFSPMRTIGGGLRLLASAGDELVVARGQYVGTLKISGLKGTAAAPIVIRGVRREATEEERANPTFDAAAFGPVIKPDRRARRGFFEKPDTTIEQGGKVYQKVDKGEGDQGEKVTALTIADCSYVILDGLTVTQATNYGIMIENSDHVTIRNCDVLDCANSLVRAEGSANLVVDNCTLAGSKAEHGVFVLTGDGPTVRNCRIYGNAMCGIHLNANKLAGGDGLLCDAIIENNLLYGNGKGGSAGAPSGDEGRAGRRRRPGSSGSSGSQPRPLRHGAAAIACDGFERGIIRNNVIHHNHIGGIVLYREYAARAGKNSFVVNNTVYLPAEFGSAYGIYLALMSQGCTAYNNVVVTARGPALWIGSGASLDLLSDYNVLCRLDGKDAMKRDKDEMSLKRWQELYRVDRNTLEFKPTFVDADNADPAKCDLRLLADTTLAGRGLFCREAPTDFAGESRRHDRVTPGAFELMPGTKPAAQPAKPTKRPQEPPPVLPQEPPSGPGLVLPPVD